jgi:flagellar basal body P-ring formation protein FlgA
MRRVVRSAWVALLIASTGIGGALASPASPRDALIDSIRTWAAAQAATSPSQVEVGPLDARLQVRDCSQPLAYDFPFSSRNTVRVRCAAPDWQLHIRVVYSQQPPGGSPVANAGSATNSTNTANAGQPGHANAPRGEADRVTVVVARSNLRAGQILTPDQVEATQVDGRGQPRDLLSSTDGLEQFEAVRPLRAGEPIRPTDLRPAVLVRKGQSVVLSLRSDTLSIEVRLEATQDGRMGDQIRLVNPESGRTVSGIVTGRNAARMI